MSSTQEPIDVERRADIEAETARMQPEALDPKPASVRAKFKVVDIKRTAHTGAQVSGLEPRYDPSIPEDQRFLEATPWGRLEMLIDNSAAIEVLMPGDELGHEFYLDLTPCPNA